MKKFKCIKQDKFKTEYILKENAYRGEKDKYYYLYKIEFPNGKYYLGKHTTKNINDGYGGSGVLLPREYSHNDINLTNKIILKFFKNSDELDEGEIKLIGDLYLKDEKCLNYRKGGSGGINELIADKISNSKKGIKRSRESIEKQRIKCIGKKHTDKTKQKQSEWHKEFWTSEDGEMRKLKMSKIMKNKGRTNETKEKISQIAKKRFSDKNYRLKNNLKYYQKEIDELYHSKEIYNILNKDVYSTEEYDFLREILDNFKKKRAEKRVENKKKEKVKYIFTEEHKRKISESRKGIKAKNETKILFSEQRKGRNNSNYCNDTIFMINPLTNEIVKEFYDCIEATNFVKNNINHKARGSEIFQACRKGVVRYQYKWKQQRK